MKRRLVMSLMFALALGVLAGCPKPAPMAEVTAQYDRPIAPGESALRKITDPNELPDLRKACNNIVGLYLLTVLYFNRKDILS